MDRNDQKAIESLFGKLASVERQSAPRDGESEAFIREQIARQPGAPYYMAQTIVVQEQALEAAHARIQALEARASDAPRQPTGLLGSLFRDSRPQARSGSVPRIARSQVAESMLSMPAAGQSQRGGGFLSGAAQTAMGVAGGMLLANAIGGMLGGDGEAQAAETPADAPETDDAGFDDGGDFGDMGF